MTQAGRYSLLSGDNDALAEVPGPADLTGTTSGLSDGKARAGGTIDQAKCGPLASTATAFAPSVGLALAVLTPLGVTLTQYDPAGSCKRRKPAWMR